MSASRWLIVIVGLIVIAAVAVLLWPRTPEPDLPSRGLPVPERGAVIAEFAADGHPVWVIGHRDGSISVLDAFSSHVPFGVYKPTWFCPDSRVFEDPFHGSRYDEFGDSVAGPAPIGLGSYAFEAEGDELLIAEEPRQGRRAQGVRAGEPPSGCTVDDAFMHDYATLPEAGSPGDAEAFGEGWMRLRATLIPDPATASALLCPGRAPAEDCALVDLPGMAGLLTTPRERAQASVDAWTDTDWLVHVREGRIIQIADLLD